MSVSNTGNNSTCYSQFVMDQVYRVALILFYSIIYFWITVSCESPIYNFNINVANSDASGKVSNNPVQNTPTTKQSEILARNKDLKYAGKFGNKMYFTLPTAGSWKYARDACAGAKLQMIALASYAERDYINNALGTSTRYWTSGKQVDAYKWENGTNVGLVYRSAWIENCLLIYFGGIYADPCNGKAFEYYPLCQTDSDN